MNFQTWGNHSMLIILELGYQNIVTLDAGIKLRLINLVGSLLNFVHLQLKNNIQSLIICQPKSRDCFISKSPEH
jgi:hypothetical protein